MTATTMRPPSTADAKKKRRRMKQMEGLLLISRPRAEDARLASEEHARPRAVRPKKVHVVLQPQQLQLAYSAQEDQEMEELLGRVDLVGATLEQAPDGFVIHGASMGKKFKLHDSDRATIDAWFYAVYAAITEFARAPVDATPADTSAWMFSGVLSASLRDEATEVVEFELACQLVVPSRSLDEPSIRWKVWHTANEIQAFDDELRRIPWAASLLRDVGFPRERKRDSIFGGLRRKSVRELKEQQLSVYIGRLFSIRQLAADPATSAAIRRFLKFDHFFELSCERVDEDTTAVEEEADAVSPEGAAEAEYPVSEDAAVDLAEESNQSDAAREFANEVADTFEPAPAVLQSRLSRAVSVHFDDELEEIDDVAPEADPAAAKKLHKEIICMVRDIFGGDEDRVRDFQDQTKDFGREKTDAKEYCAFLHGALGSKQCCVVIPMMARLLPDEAKRHALLEARTAIIRKAVRRNRRRSKQFSESVVMHQQQQEQRQTNQNEWLSAAPPRTRPKSDTFSTQPSLSASYYGQRSSMVEPRNFTNANDTSGFQRTSFEDAGGRKSLPDARRKFESRPSLSIFGETIQSNTIEEESSSARDSEDTLVSSEKEGLHDKRPEAPSPEMKSLPPVFRRVNSNSWLQQPRSVPLSTQPGYGQRASVGRSRDAARSVESIGAVSVESDQDVPEQAPADEVEENPVLARLRKQGAVSFMLR